jgi:hypothetical protein
MADYSTKQIIDYAYDDEGVEFRKALYASIHDKVTAAIEAKKQEVAENLLGLNDEEEQEEEYELEEEFEELDEDKYDHPLYNRKTMKRYYKQTGGYHKGDPDTNPNLVNRPKNWHRDSGLVYDKKSAHNKEMERQEKMREEVDGEQ